MRLSFFLLIILFMISTFCMFFLLFIKQMELMRIIRGTPTHNYCCEFEPLVKTNNRKSGAN